MAKKAKAAETEPVEALGPRPRLVKLIIKNFRCIGASPVTIDLDDIVVLVGPNNVGKSSVLKAYEVIMSEGSTAGHLSIDDFPASKVDPNALPEIELHTIVYDNSPGPECSKKAEGSHLQIQVLNDDQRGCLAHFFACSMPVGESP
jgi:putative ATP-dependent endonuclease of OLD family